jgi:hypothetical protein
MSMPEQVQTATGPQANDAVTAKHVTRGVVSQRDELLATTFAEVVLTVGWLMTDIRARTSDEGDPVPALRLLNYAVKVLCRVAQTQKAIMQLKVAERYREKALEECETAKATLEKAREKMQHSKRQGRRRFPRRLQKQPPNATQRHHRHRS